MFDIPGCKLLKSLSQQFSASSKKLILQQVKFPLPELLKFELESSCHCKISPLNFAHRFCIIVIHIFNSLLNSAGEECARAPIIISGAAWDFQSARENSHLQHRGVSLCMAGAWRMLLHYLLRVRDSRSSSRICISMALRRIMSQRVHVVSLC